MRPIKGMVNSVELIGWLGADPETRCMPSGIAVTTLSVGTKRIGRRQDDGAWNYETDWFDVEVFDRLAEVGLANLQKGNRVRVIGRLRTDTWQDREGNVRKRIIVRADDLLFLDVRQSHEEAVLVEV